MTTEAAAMRITDDADDEPLPTPEEEANAAAVAAKLFPHAAKLFPQDLSASEDMAAAIEYADSCHRLGYARWLEDQRSGLFWHLLGDAICPVEINILLEWDDDFAAYDPFSDIVLAFGPGPARAAALRASTQDVLELKPTTPHQLARKALIVAKVGLVARLRRQRKLSDDPEAKAAIRSDFERLAQLPLHVVAGAVDHRFRAASPAGADARTALDEHLVQEAIHDAGPKWEAVIAADADRLWEAGARAAI
jgi:hypothetical protein